MTSLKRLVGMPLVLSGGVVGYVERGVLTQGGKRLGGIVLRSGLQGAKWVPRAHIELIGASCVLISRRPERVPKSADMRLAQAYQTGGRCLGIVTDALLDADTLRVKALEISHGPLYHIMGKHAYATGFSLRKDDAGGISAREVVVSRLCSLEELKSRY